MLRIVSITVACMALASCGFDGSHLSSIPAGAAAAADSAGVPPPVTVADRTTIDEKTVIAFEKSVTLAANLATIAVKAGAIRGDNLDRLSALEVQAKGAVRRVRAAYAAGNATSYKAAIADLSTALDGLSSLIPGVTK